MEQTITPEQTTNSVNAAFDSVNLINNISTEVIDDEKKDRVKRNIEHLEVMLAKEWFLTALTPIQKTNIDACIVTGNAYIA